MYIIVIIIVIVVIITRNAVFLIVQQQTVTATTWRVGLKCRPEKKRRNTLKQHSYIEK